MGYKYQDLTGQTFGNIVVLGFDHTDKKYSYWKCQCLCGNPQIFIKRVDNVKKSGKNCGCLLRTKLIGQQFNQLTILNFSHIDKWGSIVWECQCSCGNIIYATTSVLKSNHIKSCGCTNSFIEKEITHILLNENISFQQQYTFQDLISKKRMKLKFDFALFYDNQLIGLIEYQGQQHYDINSGWYSEEGVSRDNQKIDYCSKKNIPLLILNKDNYNIEIIINFYKRTIGGKEK